MKTACKPALFRRASQRMDGVRPLCRMQQFSNLHRGLVSASACLLAFAVSLACPFATGAEPVLPPPGLVSWWPAEGNAQDIVGGNPGLNLDGVTFAAGVVGEAFYFDGANRKIVPRSLDFRGSGWTSYIRPGVLDNFTMEFWVFPTASRAATSQETSGWPGISGQRYAIAPQYGGTDGPAGVGVSVGINGISVFEHAGNYMPSPLVHAAPIPG